MAASTLSLLLLVLLAATASARPCKTIFYFSAAATTTTTTSYYPHNSLPRNPIPNFRIQHRNPSYITLIFTTTQLPQHNPSLNFDSINTVNADPQSSSTIKQSDFPVDLNAPVSSSVRRRIGDILSVVGALLFGVGCGVLTGATLYFVWALFSLRRFELEEEEEDDVAAAKKLGYVEIPTKAKVVDY
ncbi:hypothetical protein BUALT_Bualt13G0038600 [Buddleja alternifolia]|uniref:Transmembrane protein n=1 Tax=Buddleja alternifolia TaxID=168488 RepID=A0AAV6WPZ4_9LAMI|nr:hypothetical protein BUALT_Bualt13G0038600 [Buddleja alternifolia]